MENNIKLYLYFNLGFNLDKKQLLEMLNLDKSSGSYKELMYASKELIEILKEILQNDPSSNFNLFIDSNFNFDDVINNLTAPHHNKKEILLYLGRDISRLVFLPYYQMKSHLNDLILQIKIKMNRLELPSRTMEMLDKLKLVNSEEYANAVMVYYNELLVDIMSKYIIEVSLYNKYNKKVFIVHGHDDAAKYEIARTLEKLELEAIILHEQPSGGKTIIEKIEAYSDVSFVVVLYTQCDVGRAKEKTETEEKYRARQNVVFEHGYLLGKLGRERVHALLKGDIEIPSDMSGVVYTNMDDAGAWKLTLANEMKETGIPVDMNRLNT